MDIQQLTSHPQVQQVINSPIAQKSLGTILALGLVRYVNKSLSQWAVNNWRSDSWQGENELVLITGGAAGIGRQVMEDLSRAGVRVVILDIKDPDFQLRMYFFFFFSLSGEILIYARQRVLMKHSQEGGFLPLRHHQLPQHQGRGRADSRPTWRSHSAGQQRRCRP